PVAVLAETLAVVTGDDDNRVVGDAELRQVVEQLAELIVGEGDLSLVELPDARQIRRVRREVLILDLVNRVDRSVDRSLVIETEDVIPPRRRRVRVVRIEVV